MKPEISFKRTSQLSVAEKEQIRELFLRVFEKKMDRALLERKYLCTPKGYSYHGLMLHDKVIVGTFNAIPYRYKYFGREMIFGLSVDTMIDAEHRGGKYLVKMANLVYESLIDEGIPFIFGFPNEYFYRHEKRIMKTRDIGNLNYYVQPINIGAVIPKMRLLNLLSQYFTKIIISLPLTLHSPERKYNIEKVGGKEFEKYRYDDSYSRIALGDEAVCIYKIHEEENKVRTLYIIDVLPLTPTIFAKAIKQIYRVTHKSIDLMIYVGNLSFRSTRLLKLPNFKQPKKIRMTGKILIPGVVDYSVFAIENWNVNLSNFDVR